MSSDRPSRFVPIATAVLIFAAAWLTYHSLIGLGLLGWDTYPMILTSRIASFSDFAGTFTEELMDGRYTDGHFYRPLTNLSLAINEWFSGLGAGGYHATDVLLVGATGVLIFGLCRQLLPARMGVAPVIAALAFVIHPIHLELIPIVPRRADSLALLFTLAAVYCAGRTAPRAWVPLTLCTLFAVAAKETGIAALVLVGLRLVLDDRSTAMRRLIPCASAVAVFAAARTAVLGGIGGHAESGWVGFDGLRAMLQPYFARVVYPQPFLSTTGAGQAWLLAAAALGMLTMLLMLRRPLTSVVSERANQKRLFILLTGFVLVGLAISSTSGRVHDWYALLFCAPYAIALGLFIEYGISALRMNQRVLGAVVLLLPSALFVSHVAYSNLVVEYEDWTEASVLHAQCVGRIDSVLGNARPGDVVIVDEFIPGFPPRPDGAGIRSVAIIADYSVQAYAELSRPGLPVAVAPFGAPPPASDPSVVGVALKPGALPAFLQKRLP